MLDFVRENWEVIFGGVGTAIVAAILGVVFKSRRAREKPKQVGPSLSATAGNHSQIVQAGRDAKVGEYPAKDKKKATSDGKETET